MVQFSHTLAAQVRLDVEAQHLSLFRRNFRQWRDVDFPAPMLSNEAVIVESFEPGDSVARSVVNGQWCSNERTGDEAHLDRARSPFARQEKGESAHRDRVVADRVMRRFVCRGSLSVISKW